MSKIKSRIEELQLEIELLSQIENKARARLNGDDEEWKAAREKAIDKMCALISSYKIEDQPHKAVYIIGQLMSDAKKLQTPGRVINDIENKRKMLYALRDQVREADAKRAIAREEFEKYNARRST